MMKSIKDFSKKWCCEHSNKGCKVQCDGCWQIKSAWGCEQHNMELACEAGANYVLKKFEKELKRRMFEDYNQGAEEDEIAQGCMASMIAFIKQLKK